GFAPTAGGAGTTITVTGAGFTGLQSARIGSTAASFTVASDTQLALVVPAGAQTGRIELAAAGRSVLSAVDFTVSGVPQVTALSPTSVLPGGRVTLTGSSLDRVAQVRVNVTVLPIASQAATSLVVDVPQGATSGTITLIDSDGASRPQSQQLTVVAPMTLASFDPVSVVSGQALTVNGTNLDRATAVVFSGGASAPIATRSGSTRITVTVPDAAQSGVVQLLGTAGDQVVSAAPLAVVPAIRVDSSAVYRVATAGADVTIAGSGLTEVAAVTVRGIAATVVSRTATQLVFTTPAGVACGAVSLLSSSQPAVPGGSVVVGNGCTAALAGIEFAQVLSQATTDARQRLVPGKETWVRAYVVSDQAGLPSPMVRVTGYRGTLILGTLQMSGPATLPTTSGGTLTDAIRYSEAQSFNAELPASWVASGLSVRVEVDPERQLGPSTVQDATPGVGTATRLEIVLVPVVSGAFVPTVPSTGAVLDELTRRFPIPRDRIVVTTRAPYTLAGVTDGIDTSTEWSSALSELRQLRDSENPGNAYRYYFGFVRRSGGTTAGIGYVPGRTALGWDSSSGWPRTMSHELGHNFGRPHAPCGSVTGADANYPYAGGALGPTPLVDSVPAPLDVISPVNLTDIMGYCSGSWFSDYNYRLMQSHLESLPQASIELAQSEPDRADLLQVAGAIGLAGVVLGPVRASRGVPEFAAGEYTLRLVTQDGRTLDHPFDADLVDHAVPPERHFTLAVLDPGPLERIEVWRAGELLPLQGARAQRTPAAGREAPRIDWSEDGGRLSMRWNAASAAYASVTHVLDGERRVLALHRQGGTLEVETDGLPAGGSFEISVSDGLNAQRLTVPRGAGGAATAPAAR
ncbi:MAG: IPT/TIG domain-containing protein, partial [Betaproteobacteria bacterium]